MLLELRLSAQAQNPAGANAQKHGIAVVDISYIFKKHDRFRATMEAMKKEMTTPRPSSRPTATRFAQMEEQRNTFNAGSPEYKQLDEELARNMAEFNLKMTRLRKSFLEREAKVYYQTYLEVSDAVKYYAERHDIGIVIRFNGEPVDPNRREDVLREINKPVVFQNQIDITPDILALLNRDAAANAASRPAARRDRRFPGNRPPRSVVGRQFGPAGGCETDRSRIRPPQCPPRTPPHSGACCRCLFRAANARFANRSRWKASATSAAGTSGSNFARPRPARASRLSAAI